MKRLLLLGLLGLVSSIFGQVDRIDRSDSTIHIVQDFWYYQHWALYPATSAVYVPPCAYRIVQPDSSNFDFNAYDYRNDREQFQLVEQYGKYGIINAGDTLIIPIQYDSLIRITSSWPKVFIAKTNNKYGLLNSENEIVVPFEYDRIHLMTNGQYSGFMTSSLQVEKGEKKGLLRIDGSVELSCNYDYINTFCWQADCPKAGIQYCVGINGKYGYINQDESVAIELKYEGINAAGFSGLILAKNNGKVGLMDTLENFILPQEYDRLFPEKMERFPHLTAFKKDGKWGLMQGEYSAMEVILENQFDSVFAAYDFKDHFIIINDSKWGLADTNGQVVIEPQYQEIDAMEDGTFAYRQEGKWGLMSNTGAIHCAPRYDSIYDNEKNWCLVTQEGLFGFCKTSGDEIIAPLYQVPIWDDYLHWGELIYAGHIALSKGGDSYADCRMGVIDSNGRIILPFEYDCGDEIVYSFGTGLIATKKGRDVLISSDGQEVYLGDYDRIERRRYGYDYFFPMKGRKMGLASPEGKLISTPKYDRIELLFIGMGEGQDSIPPSTYFLVEAQEKVGLLDSNGQIVLGPVYQELVLNENYTVELFSDSKIQLYNLKTSQFQPFSGANMYEFKRNIGIFRGAGGKWLFIDSTGNRINEVIYDQIRLIGPSSNYYEVRKGGRLGICDSTGTLLFEPKFTKIKYWDGEFGAGKSGNKYCFFNAKGDVIVGYRYRKVKGVYGDFVCIRIDNRFGVVTKSGEVIIAPTLNQKLNFDLLEQFGLTSFWRDYEVGVIDSQMKTVLNPNFNRIELVKVNNQVYILAYKNVTIELYDAMGQRISADTFIQWEQNGTGELFLLNDQGWFKPNKDGGLVKTER